jgi:hypothetical protein
MGAVQAQDYPGSLWAVGLRVRGAREADVEHAIASRAIVRTWPMRGTLHYVAADDVRWMLRLLAPRVMARAAGRHRELELDDASFALGRRILSRALEGGPLTRPETYAALAAGGLSPAGQRGIHVIGHLAQQGFLCHGPRQRRQPTFVRLDDWVPASPDLTRDEALARLATRYFASHGPATLQDFAWWSGLLVAEARRAMEIAGAGLAPVTARTPKGPTALLLPPWDEYLVAYRDRTAMVRDLDGRESERLKMVGSAAIVIDGRVRGAWKRTLTGSAVWVRPEMWTRVSGPERAAVREAAARYGRFLGRTAEVR